MPPSNAPSSTSNPNPPETSKINIRTTSFTNLYTLPPPSQPLLTTPPTLPSLALLIGSDPSLRTLDTLLQSDEGDSMTVGSYTTQLVDVVGTALGRAVSASASSAGEKSVGGASSKVVKLRKRPAGAGTGVSVGGGGSPRLGGAPTAATTGMMGGGVRGVGGRFQTRKVGSTIQTSAGGMSAKTPTRKASMGAMPQIYTDAVELPAKKRRIEIEFSIVVNIREGSEDEDEDEEVDAVKVKGERKAVKNPTKAGKKREGGELEVDDALSSSVTSKHPGANSTQDHETAGVEEGEDSLVFKTDGLVLDSDRKRYGSVGRSARDGIVDGGTGSISGVSGQEGGVFSAAKRSVGELDGEIEESPPKRSK